MGDFAPVAAVWVKSFPLMVSRTRSDAGLTCKRWEVRGVYIGVASFQTDFDGQFLPHPDEGWVVSEVDLLFLDVFNGVTNAFSISPSPSIRFDGGTSNFLPRSENDLDVLANAFEESGVTVFSDKGHTADLGNFWNSEGRAARRTRWGIE
jgi:hypothetical protein